MEVCPHVVRIHTKRHRACAVPADCDGEILVAAGHVGMQKGQWGKGLGCSPDGVTPYCIIHRSNAEPSGCSRPQWGGTTVIAQRKP